MSDVATYRTVLCEDEPLLLEALRRKIEKSGQPFQVVSMAQNGRDALALLSNHPADLLITDIRMPVMDGMELLRQVMERRLASSCVLLSGYSDFEYARTALRNGAFDYLLKPLSQEDLNRTLTRVRIHLSAQLDAERGLLVDPSAAQVDDALEAIRQYILSHAFEEFSISQLCEAWNYSAAHLSRLFAKKYGEPPQRYQTSLRLSESKRLLAQFPDQPVRQIAERVGYQDQGYFSRLFRQATGKSPQQYREDAMASKGALPNDQA